MNRETIRGVLIACVGLPLLLVHSAWATPVLHCYLLTAFLFGLLLVPDYPPVNTGSFWKATIPISAIHSIVVLGIIKLDLEWPMIFGPVVPARMVYGFLGVILVAEWRLALYLIERPESK